MKATYKTMIAALAGFVCLTAARAQGHKSGYIETDLVVNREMNGVPTLVDRYGFTHTAKFVDPNLVNPWGIASSATSALWVGDGGAGVATLYNGEGTPQSLVVSIPTAGNPLVPGATPTGVIFNNLPAAQGAFAVSGVNSSGVAVTAPAVFLFATKEGTIAGWNPGVNPVGFDPLKAGKYAITVVDRTGHGAYTGLAIAGDAQGVSRLYAANFGAGTVDVFDTSFRPLSYPDAFVDHYLPKGYAPFNVVPLNVRGEPRIFVTYALQDLTKLFGQGRGLINTFRLDGTAPQRFAQHGQLSAPWAIVATPESFGDLGGYLWIGNFGDGRINAFDLTSGRFAGKVKDATGQPIVIDGLWGLRFGNGGNGGDPKTLYFTAGPNGEHDGLLGAIAPK
jgi:uncharacterized protein (TIGR03118 family)